MTLTVSRPPRRLTDDEIARTVAAGRRLGYPIGTLVETMALTGAPPRATRFMRWADINREQALWQPRPQKNEDPVTEPVPLVSDVLKLLDGVPARDHDYVFAGPSGKACADNARKRGVIARAAGLSDLELADIWHTVKAEIRHPEKREVLENWAELIQSLIAPPDQPDTAIPLTVEKPKSQTSSD